MRHKASRSGFNQQIQERKEGELELEQGPCHKLQHWRNGKIPLRMENIEDQVAEVPSDESFVYPSASLEMDFLSLGGKSSRIWEFCCL